MFWGINTLIFTFLHSGSVLAVFSWNHAIHTLSTMTWCNACYLLISTYLHLKIKFLYPITYHYRNSGAISMVTAYILDVTPVLFSNSDLSHMDKEEQVIKLPINCILSKKRTPLVTASPCS